MVNKAAFISTGKALLPFDDGAFNLLRGFPAGKAVMVEVWSPRNIDHHRKFFKILKMVVDNSDRWDNVEALRDALMLETQHVDIRKNLADKVYVIPKSINFESMSQADFQIVFDDCMRVIEEQILPGLDRQSLIDEVDDMLRRPKGNTRRRTHGTN